MISALAELSSAVAGVPGSDVDYASAGDPWIGFAVQQLRQGTRDRALQAYEGAFKRFADTAHSQKLHEEVCRTGPRSRGPTRSH